jgi:hypothetical protein
MKLLDVVGGAQQVIKTKNKTKKTKKNKTKQKKSDLMVVDRIEWKEGSTS